MKISSKYLEVLIGFGAFIVLWQILSLIMSNIFLPSPFKVAEALVVLFSGTIYLHILTSLKRTLIGFVFALIIAASLAYIVGTSKKLKDYFNPVIELLRPIPPIAWIPLAILWFGVGDASSSFIIFIAAFFPIFTNVYFGVVSLPKVYHRVSHNYHINGINKFVHVIFPYSLPYLITGCKTSIGFSWMAVIAAEMIAANYGLGYFIEINRVLIKPDYVIATMIIIGVIGFLMHYILLNIEKNFTSWRAR